MLETLEEYENSLGRTTERDFYFLMYHYETEEDRQYALKFWMEDFIEGEAIRPSRPVRKYDYARPTIILINPNNIIILTYECKYYDDYDFEDWKDRMMEYFGDKDETMIAAVKLQGEYYFLDATNKFLPFPYPSSFTQGKQALINIGPEEFLLKEVPTLSASQNHETDSCYMLAYRITNRH